MKNISIISIPVTDQQRAKEFYVKLGFTIQTEAPFGPNNQQWIQLSLPDGNTSITLVNWFDEMPAGSMRGFVIDTDNLEQEIETLQSRGIEVGKIDTTPWGKFVSVRDPDGNGISIHEQ
jgi:predicted enzyme related to lactoylglutathione lyase